MDYLIGALIVGFIGFKIYQNVTGVTENMTVIDIDEAGVTSKASGLSVGLTRHISVGGGKSKKAGKAIVALKDEEGVIEEYKVKAKFLMRSEIRVGDICQVKHWKKTILNLEVDRRARYAGQ